MDTTDQQSEAQRVREHVIAPFKIAWQRGLRQIDAARQS